MVDLWLLDTYGQLQVDWHKNQYEQQEAIELIERSRYVAVVVGIVILCC